MSPTLQRVMRWAGAVAVTAFGAASLGAYRLGRVTDRDIASDELKAALSSLDTGELDSAARLAAYRDGLSRTDTHLRRAINSNPVDTVSIERLAAVRWELGVLAGDPDAAAVHSLVGIAAERARRVPEVQAEIGALLYRMGSPVEAAPFMRRALELSPAMTNRVVTSMRDAGVEPDTIASTLPRTVEVMLILRQDLARSGHIQDWILSAEELLPDHPGDLLWAYTDACLAVNAEDRLLEHIERLGVLAEASAEAKRQIALGRVQLARKAWGLAASTAARARALSPTDSAVLDFAGQMAFSAGDWGQAEAAFRDALSAIALEGAREIDRARLYRQRGRALEHLGRVDDAFDAYRRALELLPDDPWLTQRFAASSPKSPPEGRP